MSFRSMSRAAWHALQSRIFPPRPKVKREKREKKQPRKWEATCSVDRFRPRYLSAIAFTKSEARAIMKKELGLNRLPPGMVLSQCD